MQIGQFAPSAPRLRNWGPGLLWALFVVGVLFFQFRKGLIDQVQGVGLVYWWLDYGDGMVRRGVVGQLFQVFMGTLSQAELAAPVCSLHVAVLICLAAAAVIPAAIVFGRLSWRDRLAYAAIALWFFTSQLWSTLAYNVGYLDVYLLLIALAAALCLDRGWTIACAVIMVLGPFVHEYFLFLTPFILAFGWRRPAAGRTVVAALRSSLVLCGLSFAAAAAVIVLSEPSASLAQLADMPLDPAFKQELLSSTLGQGFGSALSRMMGLLFDDIGFTLLNFAFYLAPALILCLGIVCWKAPRRDPLPWIQAAAGLFPAAALLLAWDLSRLLVMTSFTCGMLFLQAAMRRTATHAR